MPNLIDTHFHLDHYRNYGEIANIITGLKQYTLCVTNSPGVFLSCKKMIPETKYLRFAIGFHPLEKELKENDLRDFIRLLAKTNYVGEIGLDFTKSSYMDRETQIRSFDRIVEKCTSENKLMTVHIRKAEAEAIEIIKRYAPRKCIIHWFTGTEKQIDELLELGCYMSVNSNMVISRYNSKYLRIPADRILIESDGPYTKIEGKKYTPDMLSQSYQIISRFFDIPNLGTIVSSNFRTILEK